MKKGKHVTKEIKLRDMAIYILQKWVEIGRYNPLLMIPELAQEFGRTETTVKLWVAEIEGRGMIPSYKGSE